MTAFVDEAVLEKKKIPDSSSRSQNLSFQFLESEEEVAPVAEAEETPAESVFITKENGASKSGLAFGAGSPSDYCDDGIDAEDAEDFASEEVAAQQPKISAYGTGATYKDYADRSKPADLVRARAIAQKLGLTTSSEEEEFDIPTFIRRSQEHDIKK